MKDPGAELLALTMRAAEQVRRRERPGLFGLFRAWLRRRACRQERHDYVGWKFDHKIAVFDPHDNNPNARPTSRREIWRARCQHCGAPGSRVVPMS